MNSAVAWPTSVCVSVRATTSQNSAPDRALTPTVIASRAEPVRRCRCPDALLRKAAALVLPTWPLSPDGPQVEHSGDCRWCALPGLLTSFGLARHAQPGPPPELPDNTGWRSGAASAVSSCSAPSKSMDSLMPMRSCSRRSGAGAHQFHAGEAHERGDEGASDEEGVDEHRQGEADAEQLDEAHPAVANARNTTAMSGRGGGHDPTGALEARLPRNARCRRCGRTPP